MNELFRCTVVVDADVIKCWHHEIRFNSPICETHHVGDAVLVQDDLAISIYLCQNLRTEINKSAHSPSSWQQLLIKRRAFLRTSSVIVTFGPARIPSATRSTVSGGCSAFGIG